MIFKVIKPGLSATWQNLGQNGLGHLGVGSGGAMDRLAAMLAQRIAGNDRDAYVYEIHFPAPVLEFYESCIIGLSGADFDARANGRHVPVNRRVVVPRGTQLEWKRKIWGERCYMAVNPFSETVIDRQNDYCTGSAAHDITISKWFLNPQKFYKPGPVRVLEGPEWDWLSESSKEELFKNHFTISPKSNRMGYQLTGHLLYKQRQDELLSSGVLPGTIQLLPAGHLILLMAGCQTTGGYPRILQVIEADLPALAQMTVGSEVHFQLANISYAEKALEALHNFVNRIYTPECI